MPIQVAQVDFGRLWAPWKALSNAGGPGAVGEDCLRAQPEFRSRPACRVAQGKAEPHAPQRESP
ncbi:MAG: hypothetical protein CVU31_16560 [Betaproteobacteria bacterium HGW-Betaproteobacteria-4]|nr:MAG: hypothetical protein CVU31_16560 [Betaproteobacteria bacterium HGW-Betaproteobacteria-4]